MGIPGVEEILDALLQLLHTAKHTPADRFLIQFGEPAFDQIQPTGTGGDEVQHKPWMLGQPTSHAFVAVGAVVVEDQVQRHGAGKFQVQTPQKFQELLMPMSGLTFADHPALHDLERGKQGGGAVPFVVVREGATASGLERQAGLGAIQRLNLALFIHAEHDRILRRGQIHAHDIRELLQKFRVARKLETFGQMRLELMFLPDPLNGVLTDALCQCQGPTAPVRGPRRLGLQGGGHDVRHGRRAIPGLAPASGRNLPNTTNALFAHPSPPQCRRAPLHLQGLGDLPIRLTLASSQNNPRAEHHLLRCRTSTNPLFQTNSFGFRENDDNAFA